MQISSLLILTYANLRNNEITMKLLITDRNDVMNNFAKLEKFLSQYNYTKLYDCRKSNARVRRGRGGGGHAPPYKLGGQNTPYKLALKDCGRGGHSRSDG